MELNEAKLKVMLDEHKGRGGELERLLTALLTRLADAEGMTEELLNETRNVFRTGVKYYRHVGAVWTLESLLNGNEYDWNSAVATEEKLNDSTDD